MSATTLAPELETESEIAGRAIEIFEREIPTLLLELREKLVEWGLGAQWVLCPYVFHHDNMVQKDGGQLSWNLRVDWSTIFEGAIDILLEVEFVGGELFYASTSDIEKLPEIQQSLGGGICIRPKWENLFERKRIVPEVVIELYDDISETLAKLPDDIIHHLHRRTEEYYGEAASKIISVADELRKVKMESRKAQ